MAVWEFLHLQELLNSGHLTVKDTNERRREVGGRRKREREG